MQGCLQGACQGCQMMYAKELVGKYVRKATHMIMQQNVLSDIDIDF
jgi:Fe-S cluster biogenesis protein NfuA